MTSYISYSLKHLCVTVFLSETVHRLLTATAVVSAEFGRLYFLLSLEMQKLKSVQETESTGVLWRAWSVLMGEYFTLNVFQRERECYLCSSFHMTHAVREGDQSL